MSNEKERRGSGASRSGRIKAKKIPSLADRERGLIQRRHFKFVRTIFEQSGFVRLTTLSKKQFRFLDSASDFDDVFLYENILVICEYTIEVNVSKHIKGKTTVFGKILDNQGEFIKFVNEKVDGNEKLNTSDYYPDHYYIAIVYSSYHEVSQEIKKEFPRFVYLDWNIVRYFTNVADTVHRSARFELLEFLGFRAQQVGQNSIRSISDNPINLDVSVLPEGYSNFAEGYKVVSFYAAPITILERAYVLRRHGWRSGFTSYQRMIDKKKICSIRQYLKDVGRVFVNNIVVTLPSDTKFLDNAGNTLNASEIKKTTSGKLQLPSGFNSIGIIDGQHRVFSYYEGGEDEERVAKLRRKQNLLITGIVYPPGISDGEKIRFEANLFLEINSTQTNAKSDVKQEVGLLLRPFELDSIAKRVIISLNDGNGPLADRFERYFYDKGKIKTTTIVSYGLKHIIKTSGDDSFFAVWNSPNKLRLLEQDEAVLGEYVQFCVSEMNMFFSAAKKNIGQERWVLTKGKGTGFLNPTTINALIGCLRRIIRSKLTRNHEYYCEKLSSIGEFDISLYKSSQYNDMAEKIFTEYFGI
ncbi:DGQHR domain-containing protein [Skermanella sp. TT6]|uniref:DGQHR domain-containing protein n=1 Tax=Skermanella cutis TaxID=2775420 RepID=A0ABX7B701_9PROT|nr:DGQHR domain-containing protein [Skermanella sp. TT6]QQP90161.1 DGQHR domain-containing protein [Skermanella sp. TT6]